ncbi:MAG: 4Fe-4S dicluster domain-containing protein [Verrucomicrobiota bacterium]|nr:4Fe-4S dicluster domain-containing protein [Verrucomicrobiota bacterium]
MKLPFFRQLFNTLRRKPETNPFPFTHQPKSVAAFLRSAAQHDVLLNPPVPVPEGARFRLLYDSRICIGCNMCLKVCTAHALEKAPGKKTVRLFRGQCICCGQCMEVCPKGCFSMDDCFMQADSDRYSAALVEE